MAYNVETLWHFVIRNCSLKFWFYLFSELAMCSLIIGWGWSHWEPVQSSMNLMRVNSWYGIRYSKCIKRIFTVFSYCNEFTQLNEFINTVISGEAPTAPLGCRCLLTIFPNTLSSILYCYHLFHFYFKVPLLNILQMLILKQNVTFYIL